MPRPHAGRYTYHDDDCRCVEGGLYCNRDGSCWSCCGACKEDSDCTAPEMHPTNPSHPLFFQTTAGTKNLRFEFKPNEEIAALFQNWKISRN